MKIALIIIVILILVVLAFLVNCGLFFKPKVTTKNMGPLKIVYKDHVGPYQETGKIQDEIYHYLLNDQNLETYKGIGIYYDNPKKVAQDQLRSKSGCIIEQKDVNKKIDLGNYDEMTIDKQEMIYAEFPFKSKMSIMLGIMKVYPLLQKYCEENGLMFRESIELYDVPNKKIIYLMLMD
ncbi:hypothetical protein HNV12_05015 [Methanococcoides sp. SA1]|nr:hypothetical protein [Methanococcoides sp. SA1]